MKEMRTCRILRLSFDIGFPSGVDWARWYFWLTWETTHAQTQRFRAQGVSHPLLIRDESIKLDIGKSSPITKEFDCEGG